MARNHNKRFTGKVAFVTGAANGIGRDAALAFARKGLRPDPAAGSGGGGLSYDGERRAIKVLLRP